MEERANVCVALENTRSSWLVIWFGKRESTNVGEGAWSEKQTVFLHSHTNPNNQPSASQPPCVGVLPPHASDARPPLDVVGQPLQLHVSGPLPLLVDGLLQPPVVVPPLLLHVYVFPRLQLRVLRHRPRPFPSLADQPLPQLVALRPPLRGLSSTCPRPQAPSSGPPRTLASSPLPRRGVGPPLPISSQSACDPTTTTTYVHTDPRQRKTSKN